MRIKTFMVALYLAGIAHAQLVYKDASSFPLLGKVTTHTLTRYERLPDSLEHISRAPLWELGRNSAGLAVRFRSNSTRIAARWEVRSNMSMSHMTNTGVKGLDLYCLLNGRWAFAGSGRPQGKSNEAVLVANMLPEEREYMLYLPLYDGITSTTCRKATDEQGADCVLWNQHLARWLRFPARHGAYQYPFALAQPGMHQPGIQWKRAARLGDSGSNGGSRRLGLRT